MFGSPSFIDAPTRRHQKGSQPMSVHPLIESLKGKLVVSVQAYPREPLRTPEHMAAMSRACELGGAAAIRCQGLSDIAAIKGRVEIPVIGLWKDGHEGVYITPTLRHARACVAAGADIVAIDATDRPRPDGKSLEDTVRPLRRRGAAMADCMTIEDIRRRRARFRPGLHHAVAQQARHRDHAGRGPDLPLLRFRPPREFGPAHHLRGARPHPRRGPLGDRRRRLGRGGGHRHHPSHQPHQLVQGCAGRVGAAASVGRPPVSA